MSFCNHKAMVGAAILSACLGVMSSALANPLSAPIGGEFLSQNSAPDTWDSNGNVPILDNTSVRGRITSINGDQVQLALSDGRTSTYNIPEFDQQLYRLRVGSDATLTLRKADNSVIAISDVTSGAGNNR